MSTSVLTRGERLVGDHRLRILFVLSAGWATLQAGRFAIPPLLPAVIGDFGVSAAVAGVALTVLQVVYAATQYASGQLSDSWTRATLILPGLAVLALGFAVLGTATGLVWFVLGVAVVGLGKGLFAVPSRALVSDLFVEHRGRALGIYSAGTDVGGLLAAGGAAVVLSVAWWQAAFLPVVVGLAGVAALYAVWNREPLETSSLEGSLLEPIRAVVTSPEQRETLLAYALFYFMVGGFVNLFPTYLAQARGFSAALASATYALVFVVGVGTKPVAGALSDRFTRRRVAVGGLLLAAASLSLMVVVPVRLAIFGLVVTHALGYKTQFPLADALFVEGAADGNRGANLGAARSVLLGVGALGPAFVGVVATAAGYGVAFGALAVCPVASAALLSRRA